MSPEIYKFDIARATKPIDWLAFREDIHADDTLDSADKEELLALISAKIHAHHQVNRFKGRWDPK